MLYSMGFCLSAYKEDTLYLSYNTYFIALLHHLKLNLVIYIQSASTA